MKGTRKFQTGWMPIYGINHKDSRDYYGKACKYAEQIRVGNKSAWASLNFADMYLGQEG